MLCAAALPSIGLADEVLSYSFEGGESLDVVSSSLESGGSAVYTENGFDGQGLLLDASYGLYLGEVSTEFSVAAMVKITSSGSTDTIFFKNMGTSSNQKWTGVLSNACTAALWSHGDTGLSWTTVAKASEAELGSWAYVVYTESNAVGTLYVNAAEIGSGTVASGSGDLYLGATYWSSDAPAGTVDEVKVYDSALSASEIAAEYDIYAEKLLSLPTEAIEDIELPTALGSKSVTWTTSDENVISSDGKVTRGSEDKSAVLTAYVDGEEKASFEIKVLKAAEQVNDEVILSYRFGEEDASGVIHDASGNGNHATAYNDLEIGENGAQFDGTDDYVKMPNGVLYGHDDITIVLTAKPGQAQEHIFAYTFGNSSSAGYMFLNTSRPTTNTIYFAATKTGSSGESAAASVPGIVKDAWGTAVVTISGSGATLYLDGIAVADVDLGMTVSDLGETEANYLAKSQYSADGYFAGEISEFTVYDYCLSAAEIKALYWTAPEYAEEDESEEYITGVSFEEDSISVSLDTFGRSDVYAAAIGLDSAGNKVGFAVSAESDGEAVLDVPEGSTIYVFAFNSEDNTAGFIYSKGENGDITYESSPDGVVITSTKSYSGGVLIAAGYDASGALAGVSVSAPEDAQTASGAYEFAIDFADAVTFELFNWESVASMVPVE